MSRGARLLASPPGLLGARILGAGLQAVSLLLLARFTTLGDFGAFGVALAVGAIALGVGSLGLSTRVLRAGHGDEEGIGRTALALAAAGSLASGLVALAAGLLLTGAVAPAVAAAAFVFADGACEVAQNLMFGTRRVPRAATITVLRRIGPVAAIGAAALLGAPSSAVFTAAAAGALASVVLVLAALRLEPTRASASARSLVGESRPYWTNGIFAMLQQLDVVAVGTLLGTRAAGVFTAAFRLASPVHIVTSLIVAQMVPSMTDALARTPAEDGGRRHLRLGLLYAGAIVLTSPLLALLAIVLLGPSFEDFWIIFVILFSNSAVSVVNQLLAARVFALHRHRSAMPWLTASSSVIGLGIVVAGALAGSLVVAALGTLAIQVLLLAGTLVVERRSVREVLA